MHTTRVGDVETVCWAGVYKDSWKSMGLLVPAAYSHPAKVAPGLAVRLFDHGFERGWWDKGSVVVDPFMGICGFGIIAAYKGLRFVGVEIEERFHRLCLENVALHRRRWEAGGDPVPVCLRGDSRNLAALVAEAAGVITSPPYADVQETRTPAAAEARRDRCRRHRARIGRDPGAPASLPQGTYGATPGQLGALKAGDADSVITSPPYAATASYQQPGSGGEGNELLRAGYTPAEVKAMRDAGDPRYLEARRAAGYSRSPDNVGNLPQGDADSVVTSPPWVDPRALSPRDNAAWVASGRLPAEGSGPGTDLNAYGASPGQLGALPAGDADSVITSPPYAASVHGRNGIDLAKCDRPGAHTQAGAQGYGDTAGNVGGLAAGDADGVVTSPPYEGCTVAGGGDNLNHCRRPSAERPPHDYGTAPGQVGALRQETYWDAVRCIYGQAYLALKPGGVACVVVKAFIRKRAVVDLPGQTWRLLLSLGFTPVERIRCLLSEETREPSLFGGVEVKKRSRVSFFRRLATKRGAPEIPYEEILVVRRPLAGVP